VFSNIHPRTDNVELHFNLSTDGGSNYNVTKTTTYFYSFHDEADTTTSLTYYTGGDLAQSTAYQIIADSIGNDADQSFSGSMTLFNPASTTYVKHFITNTNTAHAANYTKNVYIAGYGNTTSAVNAINFKMDSGNFDGTIYLYAIDNS
jgi:hypothetical protein